MIDGMKWLIVEEASVRYFRPRYLARSFRGGSFASAKVTLVGVVFECQPSCCNLDGFQFLIVGFAEQEVDVEAVFYAGAD